MFINVPWTQQHIPLPLRTCAPPNRAILFMAGSSWCRSPHKLSHSLRTKWHNRAYSLQLFPVFVNYPPTCVDVKPHPRMRNRKWTSCGVTCKEEVNLTAQCRGLVDTEPHRCIGIFVCTLARSVLLIFTLILWSLSKLEHLQFDTKDRTHALSSFTNWHMHTLVKAYFRCYCTQGPIASWPNVLMSFQRTSLISQEGNLAIVLNKHENNWVCCEVHLHL